jgi:hypothetical protein
MNTEIIRGIASDIDRARQFLDLATRTLERAQRSLCHLTFGATGEEREQVIRLADQVKAARKRADQAHDGAGLIDTAALAILGAEIKHPAAQAPSTKHAPTYICADGAAVPA